jgi:AcrR family transcriptional regulator
MEALGRHIPGVFGGRAVARLSEAAREERAGERRGQILRAALDVFGRKGFHGATIREIASAAGLAEGTIYLYFQNKQDVLKGVFALIAEDPRPAPALEAVREGDDAAFLAALIKDRVQSLAQYASFIRLVVHEADLREDLRKEFFARLHAPFVLRFEDYLRRRIADGAFRPVNTGLVASICFRMMMSYLMVQHVLDLDRSTPRYGDEANVTEMVSLILYGLTARPASSGAVPGS